MRQSPPPLPVTPSIPEDFSDRISPMIVKEVRQGLRSRTFLGSFLLLHGALLLWAAGFLSDSTRGNASAADGFFWTIVGVGLLAIAGRAQSAVRAEREGKTLELLQLTGLSARSIVTGKWSALMIESCVLVAGVLPYFVLRHYFGTLRPVEDSVVVLLLLIVAGVFAAMLTMLSCLGKVIGGLARVGLFFFGIMLLQGLFAFLAFGRSGSTGISDNMLTIGLFVVLAFPYAMIFLGVAASTIASASENTATPQRLWGLSLFLPALIAGICREYEAAGVLLASAIPGVLIVAFDSVLRRSNTALPLYSEKIASRRILRALAWMLAPTHGAGLVFTTCLWALVLVAGLGLMLSKGGRADEGKLFLAMVCLLNSVLLPAALGMLLGRVARLPFAGRYWVAFAAVALPVAALGTLTFGQFADSARVLIACFPLGVLSVMDRADTSLRLLVTVSCVHAAVWLAVLVPFILRDFAAMRRMIRGERTPLPLA